MLIPFKSIVENYGLKVNGVIHVGGHWGEEVADYYGSGVQESVWVEANPECMEQLRNVVAPYPNSLCINQCLTDNDGDEVTFNISNNEGQSSSIYDLEYHKTAHPEVSYLSSIQVKTKTLNTLFEDYSLNYSSYNFLNADIQGAELLMLKGATEILPHMDCLYLEVNQKELYKGCALVEELDEFLKGFNFIRVETEWCWDFGWGDAVYMKFKTIQL